MVDYSKDDCEMSRIALKDKETGGTWTEYPSNVWFSEDKKEIHVYKEKGNTNVYQYEGEDNQGYLLVGRYIRTDYRS